MNKSHIKLSKLEVAKVDGDALKFQNFGSILRQRFMIMTMPAVQKFTYQRSVLEEVAYTQSKDLKSLVLITTMLLIL